MRIGIDCRLWNETGVGRYIRNLVRELLKIDEKNEYVLFAKRVDEQEIKNQIANSKNKWKIVAADIHWHSVSEQVQFAQVLNKENLELMHFPYFSLPILYKKSFVVTIHDLIIHHFPTGKASTLPLPFYAMKRLGYKYILSHAIHHARKIIVPLETVRKDIVTTFRIEKGKIVVTKEGFDTSIQNTHIVSPGIKANLTKQYFLYVGNAYPHKNLEMLIDAFLGVHSKLGTQLLLVGKEDYFYKKLKAKYSDEDTLVFLHDVSDSDLAFLYTNAVATVSASLIEGFGLTPIEAVSLNSCILLSDIPAFKEIWGDDAFYCNPSSKDSIAEMLEKVFMLDKSQKKAMISACQKRIKGFSWRKMAEETIRIYESCISI